MPGYFAWCTHNYLHKYLIKIRPLNLTNSWTLQTQMLFLYFYIKCVSIAYIIYNKKKCGFLPLMWNCVVIVHHFFLWLSYPLSLRSYHPCGYLFLPWGVVVCLCFWVNWCFMPSHQLSYIMVKQSVLSRGATEKEQYTWDEIWIQDIESTVLFTVALLDSPEWVRRLCMYLTT